MRTFVARITAIIALVSAVTVGVADAASASPAPTSSPVHVSAPHSRMQAMDWWW